METLGIRKKMKFLKKLSLIVFLSLFCSVAWGGVDLNGDADVITTADITVESTPISISAWVNIDDYAGNARTILTKYDADNNTKSFLLRVADTGIIQFFTHTGVTQAGYYSVAAITEDQTQINLLAKCKVKRMPLQIRPANLQGYWALDDLADGAGINGQSFQDMSGNGNTGQGVDADEDSIAKAEEVLSYP